MEIFRDKWIHYVHCLEFTPLRCLSSWNRSFHSTMHISLRQLTPFVFCYDTFQDAIRSKTGREQPWINRSRQAEGKREGSRGALPLVFHFEDSTVFRDGFATCWSYSFNADTSIPLDLNAELTYQTNETSLVVVPCRAIKKLEFGVQNSDLIPKDLDTGNIIMESIRAFTKHELHSNIGCNNKNDTSIHLYTQ